MTTRIPVHLLDPGAATGGQVPTYDATTGRVVWADGASAPGGGGGGGDTDWNLVGEAGQPAFQSGWVNYSTGGNWGTAGFRKDANGVVHLRGLVKSGSRPATIFTLPVGYRPAMRSIFAPATASGVARVDIITDPNDSEGSPGDVSARTASGSFLSLEGITFFAEA